MSDATVRARRTGRPRSQPAADSGLSAREQILDAAAALFVDAGFSATSTRAIADRVGVKQASLYYHFSCKEEILLDLLMQSVRPSLRVAKSLASSAHRLDNPEAGLYALAVVDVRTLGEARHNIGSLYLLPEVQQEPYDRFRAERMELRDIYGHLAGSAAAAPLDVEESLIGTLIMQIVESVIHLRGEGTFTPSSGHAIASTCLRAVGLDEVQIARSRSAAIGLIRTIEDPDVREPGDS